MKNKFLTLLVATMVAGSLLVGCGGSADSNDTTNNNETTVNSEKDNQVEVSAKVDPNIEYTETQIAYLFANDADKDLSLADGKEIEIQKSSVDYPTYIVKVKDTINLYNIMKEKVGYTKSDVECEYVQFSETWGAIGSTDYSELYFVKTEEALPLIEVIEDKNATTVNDDEDNNAIEMSDRAKAFFDEVRQGIAEVNARNKEIAKKYPTNVYVEVIEVDSPEGLELIALTAPSFDDENSVRAMVARMTESGYSQYYFEYLKETDTYVEFNIYAK